MIQVVGTSFAGVASHATRQRQPLVDRWIAAYRALFVRLDVHTTLEQLALGELLSLAATRTAG
jgi:hypothetical protein